MEGSKSPFSEVALHTGVRVGEEIHKTLLVREMAGPEEDILASKKMSVSKKMSTIMSNCINQFGSITDRNQIIKMVDEMVISDRVFLLMSLRAISVGNAYNFTSVCPACEKKDDKIFDLSKVVISKAPDANSLYKEITLPSGSTVRLKVGNGHTESFIEKMANDDNAISVAILSRVDHLNDEKPSLIDIKKLSMKDRQEIRKEIDLVEGDIEDTYKAVCPSCGHEYEGEVPLNGADFFFP